MKFATQRFDKLADAIPYVGHQCITLLLRHVGNKIIPASCRAAARLSVATAEGSGRPSFIKVSCLGTPFSADYAQGRHPKHLIACRSLIPGPAPMFKPIATTPPAAVPLREGSLTRLPTPTPRRAPRARIPSQLGDP
jgi:hypothetical protein